MALARDAWRHHPASVAWSVSATAHNPLAPLHWGNDGGHITTCRNFPLALTNEFVNLPLERRIRSSSGALTSGDSPMPRRRSPQPTEVELAILRVLWARGPSTVREVHAALLGQRERQDTGYSTTLKMMQVMTDKGLLKRDESRRPQVYRPAVAEDETQRRMVDDLVRRVFGGSARKLVLRAVESEDVTPDELAEIRRLLEQMEGDKP